MDGKTYRPAGAVRTALVVACLAAVDAASAQAPGTPDLGFGGTGRVVTDLTSNNDRLYAVHAYPDGAIVGAGVTVSATTGPATSQNFLLARYLPNGQLDGGFGVGGIARLDGGGDYPDIAYALRVQPDQRLLVAGAVSDDAYIDFGVARFHADGTLDGGFGSGGIARINMAPTSSTNDYATSVAIQSDGRIVLGGAAFAVEGAFQYQRFGLVRFHVNGGWDASFGDGGRVIAPSPFSAGTDHLTAIATLPDGRLPADDSITVVGYSHARNTAIVRRYLANGQPDAGFGDGGRVLLSASSSGGVHTGLSHIRAAVLQPDGKLVVVGLGTDRGFAFVRLLPDGGLDPGFGVNGRAHVKFSGPSLYDEAFALTMQANGKLVAAGYAIAAGSADDFAVARLLASGVVDAGFGDGQGRATAAMSMVRDQAFGVAIAGSGRIALAGYAQDAAAGNQQEDLALAVFHGDPDLIFRHDFELPDAL